MNESVIIDALRSPIGIKSGKLVGIRPDDLTAQVIKEMLIRNPNIDPSLIEDVILGCAFPEGPQGMLMAKGVSILAGIPETAGGAVINRFCGSSMDALHQISTKIESGDIEIGIASGVEDILVAQRGNIIGMIREGANSYGQGFLEEVDTSIYTPSAGGVSRY